MFIVDISSSMRKSRAVELPPGPDGEDRSTEMTNLEWSLQYVKLKIQEMVGCLYLWSGERLYWSRYIMLERQTNVASSSLAQRVRAFSFLLATFN